MKISPILPIDNDKPQFPKKSEKRHRRFMFGLIFINVIVYAGIIIVALSHNYNHDCEHALHEHKELTLRVSQIYNQVLAIIQLQPFCHIYTESGNFDICMYQIQQNLPIVLSLESIDAVLTIVHNNTKTYIKLANILSI